MGKKQKYEQMAKSSETANEEKKQLGAGDKLMSPKQQTTEDKPSSDTKASSPFGAKLIPGFLRCFFEVCL